MRESLEKYRRLIQEGKVNPLRQWDGATSGTIFDPRDDSVPLTHMGFGAWNLQAGEFSGQTGPNEAVLIPMSGWVEAQAMGATLTSAREGGPFATLPAASNASAIYLPRQCDYRLRGQGELIAFFGPARGDKPPAVVGVGERDNIRRGTATWRRDVITLATTEDVTTNLVVGETYSPPSLWSGTPLHVHDLDAPENGQSDHEEVYYHVARVAGGKWGAYGAQLLFDDAGLDKAYMIHNRSAFAIPGGAHPVVSGPVSDMLYVWGLCGRPEASPKLGMLDIPEFAYLKIVGAIVDELDAQRKPAAISPARLTELARQHKLTAEQTVMLALHLRQQGFDVRVPV